MIIITGAAGFIGSCTVQKFNEIGYTDIILVDDFTKTEKLKNLETKKYIKKVERNIFFEWAAEHIKEIEFIVHLGARTDTAEFNMAVFDDLNINYTKNIWTLCVENQIPLIYASSAATYGMGENGYDDSHSVIPNLKPLNPYGVSKNEVDKWIINQKKQPPFWCGLKFFNVYGPNEYHKNRMASVVFHGYLQLIQTGKIKLFKSHHSDYKDGMQLRDFVYVKDVSDVIYFMYKNMPENGIYNLGTGNAESFLELANSIFYAMDFSPKIEFIDTPVDIRDKYQYYTQANITKLRNAGYTQQFMSLKQGVKDYINNYLANSICL